MSENNDDIRAKQAAQNAAVNTEVEVPMVRRRFLMVNPQAFLGMFRQGLVLAKKMTVLKGVPADAKVTNVTVDHVRGGIILVVESAEYDEIPMTDLPPVQLVEVDLGVKNATKPQKKKR